MAVISAVLNNRQHVVRNWLKQCYAELKKTGNVLHAERTENNGQHVMSGTETTGNMLCRTENNGQHVMQN